MKNKLIFILTFGITLFHPFIHFGQTPDLGEAAKFAVFTGAGAFTNTGPTAVTGNVGTNTLAFSGFPPGTVTGGQILVNNAVTAQAASDVTISYDYLINLTPDSVIGTSILGNGQVLTPKIYKITTAATLNGELTLDAQGNPNARFIFQIDGAFATSMFATISLINSASLCNVYWAVEGDFTLGDGAVFNGTVVATTIINLLNGSSLYGRALSRAGAINLYNTTVTLGPAPVASPISADGPVILCPGGSVTLSGNNAGVWSNNSTASDVTVFTSGDYYVTNANGCGTDTSNHIVVTVNPRTEDYGDLDINTWPVASARVPGCQMTGNAPSPYDAVTNPNVSVWAGAGMTAESAPTSGNTSASTDNFDDGLAVPGVPLNGGYTYNFIVNVNANIDDTEVFYRIWFDWNGDGNFANDESIQVGSNTMVPATYNGSGTTITAGTPVSIVVPVKPPFGASPSYKVRLLVSDLPIPDSYRADGPDYIIDWPNGEIEDYSAPAILLPITFGKITAEVKSCNVHLAFETLTELNNKQFEIEYSMDGNSWKTIDVLPGKGSSNALQMYNYIHYQPASAYNYYRIKQVDKNSNYEYSSVMTVQTNCAGAGSIVCYPNPIKDDLSVILPAGLNKADIKLVNAVGQTVVATSTLNGGTVKINTHLLLKGIYMLQVQKDGKTIYHQKLIKE